jgi:hypothetical protein
MKHLREITGENHVDIEPVTCKNLYNNGESRNEVPSREIDTAASSFKNAKKAFYLVGSTVRILLSNWNRDQIAIKVNRTRASITNCLLITRPCLKLRQHPSRSRTSTALGKSHKHMESKLSCIETQ